LPKLLKLRPQLRELKNPSAQDSRTVRNLAAATHWPILEYNGERNARQKAQRWARQNHAMAHQEKTVEKLFFPMFAMECCLSATLKIVGSKSDQAFCPIVVELPTSGVACHDQPRSRSDFSGCNIWREPSDMDNALNKKPVELAQPLV
jgi:hypothetical protein